MGNKAPTKEEQGKDSLFGNWAHASYRADKGREIYGTFGGKKRKIAFGASCFKPLILVSDC